MWSSLPGRGLHDPNGQMNQRAVILASRIPYPLDDGMRVRTFHVMREVARCMPVTIVVFEDEDSAAARASFRDALRGEHEVNVVGVARPRQYSLRRLVLGLLSRQPIQVWNNWSGDFTRALSEVVDRERPSIGIAMTTFLYPYLEQCGKMEHRVIDTHNVDSELMARYIPHIRNPLKRWYARATAKKLEALERRAFARADRVWVCSTDEQEFLRQRDSATPLRVIPNGVNVEHFASSGDSVVRGRLLFFGKLNYFPNTDGLRFLIDQVLPRVSGVSFEVKIIGTGATPEVAKLCSRSPAVELVGRVEDIRSWLATAELVIVPLRMGSGTRLKVLEALAAGRPVLSTTVGAEGIVAESGEQILIADEPERFAEQIIRVLRNPEFGDRIGKNGEEAVRRQYDWRAIGQLLRHDLGQLFRKENGPLQAESREAKRA